jgi:hypothetical protein
MVTVPPASTITSSVTWPRSVGVHPRRTKMAPTSIASGNELFIITGRNQNQAPQIGRWPQIFLGARFPVHGRPPSIGLSCEEQAAWKASVIQKLRLEVYVGDNLQIDKVAADQAGIEFIDANCFLRGELPTIQGAQ